MQCPRCDRTIRWDESFSSRFFNEWGSGSVCEVCQAEADGAPVPEPRRYPPGCRMPKKPSSDGDLPICGLCRVALPYGMDKGTPLRIRPEMLDGDSVECGGYSMCPTCLAKWRPRVAAYLKRLCRTCERLDCDAADHVRHLHADANENRIGGNMLL